MSQNITINGIVCTYATVRGGNQPRKDVVAKALSLQLPESFQFADVIPNSGIGLYIPMDDASQATQLGMALFELTYGQWTGKTQNGEFIVTSQKRGESYKVSYSPEIKGAARELVNGELHEITVSYRKVIVRSWNGSAWSAPLKLSYNVDRAVNSGRLAKRTAENWISILAHYVTGQTVTAGSGAFAPLVLEGYRKQAWQRAGGEWWNFPKSITHLCKRTEGGWVLETHRAGKAVALPVTMDRTTESNLILAIVSAEFPEELPEEEAISIGLINS